MGCRILSLDTETEDLGMTHYKTPPAHRFCWLHIPKRICYSPKFRDPSQEAWAKSLGRDRWVATYPLACLHWGEKLETGEETCPVCRNECTCCGYGRRIYVSRYGCQRTIESLEHVRFLRRQVRCCQLEVEIEIIATQTI